MEKIKKEYRDHLINAAQKSQEDYDKTIIILSGGALGISFAFLKDIVGPGPLAHTGYVFAAWLFWGGSLFAVLSSFFVSDMALRRAIKQVDAGLIYEQRRGGWLDYLTAVLNALGGLLFLAGVVIMSLFIWFNLEAINVRKESPRSTISTSYTSKPTFTVKREHREKRVSATASPSPS